MSIIRFFKKVDPEFKKTLDRVVNIKLDVNSNNSRKEQIMVKKWEKENKLNDTLALINASKLIDKMSELYAVIYNSTDEEMNDIKNYFLNTKELIENEINKPNQSYYVKSTYQTIYEKCCQIIDEINMITNNKVYIK